MGKKKKMKPYPQRFSKKFASHPFMKAQVQETPLVEEVVEAPIEPVIPVVEVAVEAPKPKRTRRTRKSSTAPKRKTVKPKAKEEE